MKFSKEKYLNSLENSRNLSIKNLSKEEQEKYKNFDIDTKILYLKESLKTNREFLREEKILKETTEEKIKREEKENKKIEREIKKDEKRKNLFFREIKRIEKLGWKCEKKPSFELLKNGWSFYFYKENSNEYFRISNHGNHREMINLIIKENIII